MAVLAAWARTLACMSIVPSVALQKPATSDLSARKAHGGTLVAFHRTGVNLTHHISHNCLADGGVAHFPNGLPDGTIKNRTAIVVRDPFAIAKAAYFHHKESTESWVHHKPMSKLRRCQHASLAEWEADKIVSANMNRGETYREFLNRVPIEVGVRAEYLRSRNEVLDMLRDWRMCRKSNMCFTVCLENFAVSSQSYNQTWSTILRYLGYSAAKHMGCVAQLDINNPSALDGLQRRNVSREQDAQVTRLVQRFDRKIGDSIMLRKSKLLNCVDTEDTD